MSLVDLRPFAALPRMESFAAPIPPVSLSDLVLPLSDNEIAEVEATLREVVELLSKTPGASGSMRRRIGLMMDCLLAVADELDGDADLEDGADEEIVCEDEGAQCDDEGQPDDNGIADFDGEAEQWGHQHRQGGWVLA